MCVPSVPHACATPPTVTVVIQRRLPCEAKNHLPCEKPAISGTGGVVLIEFVPA